MRPKFEVGEVVLLRSLTRPEINGECTVLEVLYREDGYIGHVTGEVSHFAYRTTTYSEHGGWIESALRKKHQPGEMSFDSLMASLSSPKLLTHQPEGVAPL